MQTLQDLAPHRQRQLGLRHPLPQQSIPLLQLAQ
jgi:hypothetical protein